MSCPFPESWWKIRLHEHLTLPVTNSVCSTKGEMIENLPFFTFQEKELFILVSTLADPTR